MTRVLHAVWWEPPIVAVMKLMKTVVVLSQVALGTVPMAASACSMDVVNQTQRAAAAAMRVKSAMHKQGFVFAT